MTFNGISRVFSTENDDQYNTIGAFWDELAYKYGRSNLRGLGYHWAPTTIEYVIGQKEGDIPESDCCVELPDEGWLVVKGRTQDLSKIYEEIYKDGNLTYEIEMFSDDGSCEIWYLR